MANTIHGVVRTDEMLATSASAGLHSAKYFVDTTATELDNGSVVKLDSLLEGERELWKAVAPTASDDIDTIYLVATPEVMYDERLRNLTDFYNEADTAIRCYALHTGDIFSVTAPVLDGAETAAVGSIVELQAGVKLKAVSSATGGSTAVGKIIAVEPVGTLTYYVVRVD